MGDLSRYNNIDFAMRKMAARICSNAIIEAKHKGFSCGEIARLLHCSEGHINNCQTGNPDKLLSLDNFIALIKECELGETVNELALYACGYFIPKLDVTTSTVDLLDLYSEVLREEGEDSVKIASLFKTRFRTGNIEELITDTNETIIKLLSFQEALKKIQHDNKKTK